MFILKTVLASLGSLIVLFFLTKLMGNREISQLSMFDYINGITIGSIAAEMAISIEDNALIPIIAMGVYAIVITLVSYLTCKSVKLRRFIYGGSLILFNNATLYNENFKKAKIDLNEFFIQCRNAGYFNLSDIETAILEPNGRISFLPHATTRPLTPEDMSLSPAQNKLISNVIMDGKILKDNLEATGHNEKWLFKELDKQKIKNIENVFLATCDENNNLSVYLKSSRENTHDEFI